ncbi:MAG: cell division ATP-binding protein FtsE [Clostridiaceae bacterium]|nr:cell division ATP-binding protein FtsE [Clostridiaceae bacterium]
MIEFRKVNKVYPTGTCALRNVSFSIEEGEFVFLVGESGAGKSTIFKLLTCEEHPSSGQVLIDHYNITQMKERYVPYLRRQMGLIFQDFRLIDTMTVGENVAFAMEIIGEPPKKIKQRVPLALSVVGLRNKIDEYPTELSGGEAQRVCIARAIVNRPKIIIADEPTGDLDPLNGESIMALLERINRSNGTTVLTCSHDRVLINKMRKRVIELQQGELIRDESCGQYFPSSESPSAWVPFVEREISVLNGDEESAKRKAERDALISEGEAALLQLRLEDEAEAKSKKSKGKERDLGVFSSIERESPESDKKEKSRPPKLRARRDTPKKESASIAESDEDKDIECQSNVEKESVETSPDNRLSEMARDDDLMDILRQRSARRRDRMSLDERLKHLQDAYASDASKDEVPDDEKDAGAQ